MTIASSFNREKLDPTLSKALSFSAAIAEGTDQFIVGINLTITKDATTFSHLVFDFEQTTEPDLSKAWRVWEKSNTDRGLDKFIQSMSLITRGINSQNQLVVELLSQL